MTRRSQIHATAATPLGTFANALDEERLISRHSRFGDDIWHMDHDTPGQQRSSATIRWNFVVGKGGSFSDDEYSDLRLSLKVFAASLFLDPRDARALSGGSANHTATAIRFLVTWMVRNGYRHLYELSAAASREYLQDLIETYLSEHDTTPEDIQEEISADDGVGEGALRPLVQIWTNLWRQRAALSDAGIRPLPEEPFDGKSAKSIALDLATKVAGWIPPIPDEVALPIMTAAVRMIGVPAEDVIRLDQKYSDCLVRVERCTTTHQRRVLGKVITGFQFSCCPGEILPWRQPLRSEPFAQSLVNGTWRSSRRDVHLGLRKMVENVLAACVLVLQSHAGIRINEVCGLRSGIDPATGFPSCVELRISKSGLHELFILHGKLSKMHSPAIDAEWLIGSRPRGSDHLPAPVRAIQVLERLLHRLRKRAQDGRVRNHLLLSFSAPTGYPRNGKCIGPMSIATLLHHQREFIGTFVDFASIPISSVDKTQDLSPFIRTRGACIRSHSWRKNFALYVFRVDSRMIPAIAQQFHHLSLAMTSEGYLGNDPTLIEAMDSVRTQQTARFFYEMARGVRPATGRLIKLIDEHSKELQAIIAGLNERDGMLRMQRWIIDRDLRIWFSSHGKCFLPLAPMEARCHQAAGTLHWSNRMPNHSFQTPDRCLGCQLFAIDGDNADFWIRRYLENQTAWEMARDAGLQVDYRISRERALQSAAILRAIGVGLPEIRRNVDLGPTA